MNNDATPPIVAASSRDGRRNQKRAYLEGRTGLPTVYFHGMPGSPYEIDLFDTRAGTEAVQAPDRNRRDRGSTADHLEALAATI